MPWKKADDGAHLPTPQEIAERAAEIRANWTEKQWERAVGGLPDPVEVQSQAVPKAYGVLKRREAW